LYGVNGGKAVREDGDGGRKEGFKSEEATRRSKTQHNEEIHSLYSSENILRMRTLYLK
jgi:hypothetical protein